MENLKGEITDITLKDVEEIYRTKDFGIVTSYRSGAEDNEKTFLELKNDISNAGLSFFVMVGHGQEDDAKLKKVVKVIEPSLFIINNIGTPYDNFFDFIRETGEIHKQYSVIMSSPTHRTQMLRLIPCPIVEQIFTKLNTDFDGKELPTYYSSVNGQIFAFE